MKTDREVIFSQLNEEQSYLHRPRVSDRIEPYVNFSYETNAFTPMATSSLSYHAHNDLDLKNNLFERLLLESVL